MKNKRQLAKSAKYRAPIKTTFMELLKEITSLTRDDALALEVVKRIFASHRVRLTRTLAPVRLVNNLSDRAVRRARFTRVAAWS